jgi:hypothetical protein
VKLAGVTKARMDTGVRRYDGHEYNTNVCLFPVYLIFSCCFAGPGSFVVESLSFVLFVSFVVNASSWEIHNIGNLDDVSM